MKIGPITSTHPMVATGGYVPSELERLRAACATLAQELRLCSHCLNYPTVMAKMLAGWADRLQAIAQPPETNAVDPTEGSDSEPTPRDILTYACGCVLGPDRGWVPCRPHQYVSVIRPTTR